MRNTVGAVLAVLGAAATLISPWQAWYNGRHGSTYKFWEVFGNGITGSRSGIMDSVFLVFLVTAIVAVLGALLRSRLVVGIAGVVALAFTILWMVRQGNAAGELTISSNSRGLGVGVAWALVGSLLMIIGAVVMTGRPKHAVVADRTGATIGATTGATRSAATRAPESNAIPTNPPNPSAPARRVRPDAPPMAAAGTQSTAPSERTGSERLSKEERRMLGLDQDQDAPSRGKQQD